MRTGGLALIFTNEFEVMNMYRIKTMNKISSAGLTQLDPSRFQVGDSVENEDGILVRSAPMHDYVFPDALRAIARAGGPAPTTFPSTAARKTALWSSTPPAPTPTR